ncbi:MULTISPECIES: VWA domain-containing protein [Cyanophyceae]|uniref:vWA domain-containing protein n=1 Tax=Cyanophyceae TaxID=3028117 RepID=UPI00016DCDD0|nr:MULTISPECIES: VWA domain-containing protein [Cyanophyceae]ACB00840.1 Protein containing von Willebrand factor (vWF) type A domain [Picosynechococcus sp. PCC 7002]SMH47572.1 Ca-activated chloride channel family protein [Picosynechococcus sp. OG1]SMQ81031.1 Ca-activated chloride channel family protein [Synechococcus sp. 7002]
MATSSSRKPLSQRSLTLLLSGCLLGGQILAGCQMASQRTSDTGMDAMAPQVAETESMPVMPTPDGEIPQEVPDLSQEDYNLIRDNPFQLVRTEPLSTFALDVDSGAYSNVRRFLDDGQLPPADAVRLEEMINYFTYDYPAPDNQPFAINTELSQAPWQPQHQLLRIGIKGQEIENEALPPSNLVFLFDVSGSMNDPDKLPLLKSAFRLLVNELRPEDRVSIVVYAGAAGLVLPSTSGAEKETILAALDNLEAGGSTAGGEGIELAYQEAADNFLDNGNNRIILATDGDFNVGMSSDAELIRLIEQKREQDIFLTVLGFGTGNLKDAKMEQLANNGNGNYAYIDNILEAKKVLVTEMGGTLLTLAKDVKIQVEFNPTQVQAYRLLGYENRLLTAQDFNDDTKDAGELGAGHTVTALYEIVPVGVDSPVELPTVDDLKYQETQSNSGNFAGELLQLKLRYKPPTGDNSALITQAIANDSKPLDQASPDFRFAAAVAEFGMLLRDSPYRGESSFDQVLELAQGSKGADPEGYRSEFIQLVKTAQALKF